MPGASSCSLCPNKALGWPCPGWSWRPPGRGSRRARGSRPTPQTWVPRARRGSYLAKTFLRRRARLVLACSRRSVRLGCFLLFPLPLLPYLDEPRSAPVAASTSRMNSGSCQPRRNRGFRSLLGEGLNEEPQAGARQELKARPWGGAWQISCPTRCRWAPGSQRGGAVPTAPSRAPRPTQVPEPPGPLWPAGGEEPARPSNSRHTTSCEAGRTQGWKRGLQCLWRVIPGLQTGQWPPSHCGAAYRLARTKAEGRPGMTGR